MPASEVVRFYSHGSAVVGTLLLPDGAAPASQVPGIVQGPGWLGLRDAKLYQPYHEALLAAGHRGARVRLPRLRRFRGRRDVPRSDGPGRRLAQRDRPISPVGPRSTGPGSARSGPVAPAAATRSWPPASTTGSRRPSARCRSPTAATGSTGCVASTSGSSSSSGIAADRTERVRDRGRRSWSPRATGSWSRRPSARRRRSRATSTPGSRPRSQLASAEAIFAYRPDRRRRRIAPRAADDHLRRTRRDDAGGPRATPCTSGPADPKRLVVQTGTTHYAAYAQYRDVVNPLIVDWFRAPPGRRRGPRPRGAGRRPRSCASSRPRRMTGDGRDPVRHDHPRRHAGQRRPAGSRADLAILDGRIAAIVAPGTPLDGRRDDRCHRHASSSRARSTSTRTTASRASPTRRTSSARRAACAAGGVTTSFAMPNVDPPPEHRRATRRDDRSSTRRSAIVDWNINAGRHRPRPDPGPGDARASPRSRCSWSSTPGGTTRTCRASASTTTASCWRSSRTVARDRPAAHGPSARPGPDDAHRGGLLGARRARRAGLREGVRRS